MRSWYDAHVTDEVESAIALTGQTIPRCTGMQAILSLSPVASPARPSDEVVVGSHKPTLNVGFLKHSVAFLRGPGLC